MTQETIAIIGGTGVIGSHITGRLAASGNAVVVLSRNARFAVPDAIPENARERVQLISGDTGDSAVLKEIVRACSTIMYQPSSFGIAGAVENAGEYVTETVGPIANLVDALRSNKHIVNRILLGSSSTVYGEGRYTCERCGTVRPQIRYTRPAHKNGVINWNPLCPNCKSELQPAPTVETDERLGESIYSVVKRTQEDLFIGTCKQLGISLSVLRYSTIISPWQSWHNPFTRFLEQLTAGESPVLHEDGLQSRNFIDAHDVATANIECLDHNLDGVNFFNVASKHNLSLLDFTQMLASTVAEKLGEKALPVVSDGSFVPGDVRHCQLATAKAKALCNFEATVEITESVTKLTEWFLHRKGLAKKTT